MTTLLRGSMEPARVEDGERVIFRMVSGPTEEGERTRRISLGAVLGAGLLTLGVVIIAAMIIADSGSHQGGDAIGACSIITDNTERLACYDKAVHAEPPQPFRGANAPAVFDAK